MGMLMIRCPTTGAPIPTGVTTDRPYNEASQGAHGQVSCPACGGTHIWGRQNAWVVENAGR